MIQDDIKAKNHNSREAFLQLDMIRNVGIKNIKQIQGKRDVRSRGVLSPDMSKQMPSLITGPSVSNVYLNIYSERSRTRC